MLESGRIYQITVHVLDKDRHPIHLSKVCIFVTNGASVYNFIEKDQSLASVALHCLIAMKLSDFVFDYFNSMSWQTLYIGVALLLKT